MIIGAIEHGCLNDLKKYLPQSTHPHSIKTDDFNYLFYAAKIGNFEISKYLYDSGFRLSERWVLSECKIDKIESVYNLIRDLTGKAPDKGNILMRIIEPNKIEANPKRVEVALSLLKSGFIDHKMFDESLKSLTSRSQKNAVLLKSLIREFNINNILDEN